MHSQLTRTRTTTLIKQTCCRHHEHFDLHLRLSCSWSEHVYDDIGNGIYSYVENVTNGHDLVDANADDDSDIDDAGSE